MESYWGNISNPKLVARNKIKTDDQGRISQIDLYEVPGAISEPIEPYPHIGRIVYEYDNNGKPAKRSVYDASASLEEPEVTGVFEYDTEGRLIKIQSSSGAYRSWEYNEKGQLIRTQFWAPDPSIAEKESYETYEYDDTGLLKRKNYHSKTYPEQSINRYLDHEYENGVLKSYELFLWYSSKKKYDSRGKVFFSFDLNEKREETYIPIFYHERENPIEGFMQMLKYYLQPGPRLSSIDYGDGLLIVFNYQLSSEILPTERIALKTEGIKAYKNGNLLSIEGVGIRDVEIYNMNGKRIFKLTQETDKLDLPVSAFTDKFYLVKTTTQSGKKQSIKVNL